MKSYNEQLTALRASGNLRHPSGVERQGIWISKEGKRMLNLSSNDYLGLVSWQGLREEFQASTQDRFYPYSSPSSRLLMDNFSVRTKPGKQIARSFGREAASIFNSGYHANTGTLPALTDKQTLLLANKLMHVSIVGGILLGGSPFLRYRHNDYDQLERLAQKNACQYETIIILTKGIFSMDGGVADLNRPITIKRQYPNILLYIGRAHTIGVCGKAGLGIVEEQSCIQEIDLLVGAFGKASTSMGVYLVCSRAIREYLANTMRSLIFSTALPPFQITWTSLIWEQLPSSTKERENLLVYSRLLTEVLTGRGGEIGQSHIIPFIVGKSEDYVREAEELQRKGFHCLPACPPTMPKGTSHIRFPLTVNLTIKNVHQLIVETGRALSPTGICPVSTLPDR